VRYLIYRISGELSTNFTKPDLVERSAHLLPARRRPALGLRQCPRNRGCSAPALPIICMMVVRRAGLHGHGLEGVPPEISNQAMTSPAEPLDPMLYALHPPGRFVVRRRRALQPARGSRSGERDDRGLSATLRLMWTSPCASVACDVAGLV
jgi:hypothetical protein